MTSQVTGFRYSDFVIGHSFVILVSSLVIPSNIPD